MHIIIIVIIFYCCFYFFNSLSEPPVEVNLSVLLPRDCPFDIEGEAIKCKIVFPGDYPAGLCTISVLNDDIPARLRAKVNAAVQRRAETAYKGNPAMASGLLRWMRNNIDTLLVDTLITQEYVTGIKLDVFDKTKTKTYAVEDDPSLFQHDMVKLPQTHDGKAEIIKATTKPKESKEIEKEKENQSDDKDEKDDKEDKECDDDDDDDENENENENDEESEEEEVEENEEEKKKGGKPQTMYPTTTAHRGTQLVLPSLKIEGIGIMKCTQLEIIFLCARCQYQGVASLVPDKPFQCECLKCHMEISLKYRPEPVHENSSILGYIDKEGCSLFDTLPSSYITSCLECSSSITFANVPFSTPCERNCFSCHSKIRLLFDK